MVTPATLFGSGKIQEFAAICEVEKIDVAVFDDRRTPVQQRNLEKALNVKVIDRTGLILEIFARRARTREGKLQVELARLDYERSRLVRTWTHLERQRGGTGNTGGPGETQIELDRRLIAGTISKLKRELEEVRRTRTLHRSARRKVRTRPWPWCGYTNAGKSTLFNPPDQRDESWPRTMLFATLDPTLRTVKLPDGRPAILSDTVGFISDLPHELVEAFRATLEEVQEADVVLHVRDVANPDTDAQARDVQKVLTELKVLGDDGDAEGGKTLIEVWNKIDLVDGEAREILRRPGPAAGRPRWSRPSPGEGLRRAAAPGRRPDRRHPAGRRAPGGVGRRGPGLDPPQRPGGKPRGRGGRRRSPDRPPRRPGPGPVRAAVPAGLGDGDRRLIVRGLPRSPDG